jgi:hypothetical protein
MASAVGLGAACGRLAMAGPTDASPFVSLDTRPENAALAQQAATLESEARDDLEKALVKLENNQLSGFKPGKVRNAHISTRQIKRLAIQLVILGEPAGVDFQLRADALDKLLGEVVKAARKHASLNAKVSQDRAAAMRTASLRAQKLPAIGTLAKQGKWAEAEENLYKIVDEISSLSIWYQYQDQVTMLKPFLAAQNAVDEAIKKQRVEAAQDALANSIEAQLPDLDNLLSRLQSAADGIRTTGEVDFGGEKLTGPQAMARFGDEWRTVQVAAMQCRALNLARQGATNGQAVDSADQIHARLERFSADMATALVALIEADTEQAPEAEVRQRYLAYLPTVGLLLAQSPQGSLANQAAPALEKLAARSPGLAAEVETYRGATDELLRWRRRVAAAYATGREADFPPHLDRYKQAAEEERHLLSLLPATSPTSKAGLPVPASQILQNLGTTLAGKTVTAHRFYGLPTSKKIGISPYSNRTVFQVTVGDQLDAELEVLRAELLAGGAGQPLSLAAATALATAERGDLVAVGGTYEQAALDGLVSRFGQLRTSAWPMAFGEDVMVDAATVDEPLKQVLMRFMIKPAWLQHEYMFVQLDE